MGPLVYLTLCSARNRLRARMKRLKQPRYLIGLVVGLLYFGTIFLLPRLTSRRERPELESTQKAVQTYIELFGAQFLFVIAASAWIPLGKRGPALYFTPADVDFLFTAPLSRKELITYKLLRPQIGMFIGSLFMTLIFHPWSLANSWMFFLGVALTMNVLNIYMTGVSLRRESLGSHGRVGVARQWLPLATVVAVAAILLGTLALHWSILSSLHGADVLTELSRLASTGAAGVVMWPFRTLIRLPAAATPLEFFRTLPWVLALLAVGYVWVIRSDTKFEEASAALSAEIAEKLSRVRKGQLMAAPKVRTAMRTPFVLAPEGRPEIAIFWKNLILLGRYASFRTLLRLFLLLVFVATIARTNAAGNAGALARLCATAFVLTILMGPILARNDLRRDLVNLALLKTWPVDGPALVRGEVMAPAALLTTIAWLAASGLLFFRQGLDIAPSWIVAAVLVAPGLIGLRLLAQNAIAVMWPSLFVAGPSRSYGIDVLGQRLIMTFGLLLVLLVAVVPAAIVAGLVGIGIYFLTGNAGVVIPAAILAIVLLLEAYLASHVIGKLLDRTDVSALDAQE